MEKHKKIPPANIKKVQLRLDQLLFFLQNYFAESTASTTVVSTSAQQESATTVESAAGAAASGAAVSLHAARTVKANRANKNFFMFLFIFLQALVYTVPFS